MRIFGKHNIGKENKARERNLKGQTDGELVVKGYLKRERERERERERMRERERPFLAREV